ncbi:mitochondrial aspartate-glutamate transporter agc1 [Spiromyces aspiralis]|uniref:Mitochondrial aspartate-glutamate transporter agc1 n=1 Tax=Spiromyces aspiralis TaxID=68401 RepID=A0ACC1HGH2_9FUNG|nr:mitochondrial aspartate-glutamate transporter agc1 [Spiromyces aspiralis]
MTINDETTAAASSLPKLAHAPLEILHVDPAASTADAAGQHYLSRDDFIAALASSAATEEEYARLGDLFDILVPEDSATMPLEKFKSFQSLMERPDAPYALLFERLDPEGSGKISLQDAKRIFRQNFGLGAAGSWPDFESHVLRRYFGPRSTATYQQFVQALNELRRERARVAFEAYDPKRTGTIAIDDFLAITPKFTSHIAPARDSSASTISRDHLRLLADPDGTVSYSTYAAFMGAISSTAAIEAAATRAVAALPKGRFTRSDFARAALELGRTPVPTPLEIDVIFRLAGAVSGTDNEQISKADLRPVLDLGLFPSVSPSAPKPAISAAAQRGGHKAEATAAAASSGGLLTSIMISAYNFGLGAIAGGVGATVVYPIDLVKTRMQNQRSAVVGEIMYKNSFDCFKKVLRNEGAMGLYRGLGPQLVGVAPEKAIKLTVNDLMRGLTTDKATGQISLWAEIASGGTAGGCQVIFTNPLEIVKIRLQTQGEMLRAPAEGGATPIARRGAVAIVKELGLLGLYKGAGACLLRDIPFSAIYFPCYAHVKKDIFHEDTRKLGIIDLLLSGAIAGMPAAYLTTPADVIKTRLQVEARSGETVYNGIVDAARKIYREEGLAAFFKGGLPRIFRSSPQFGATLMCYEVLHRHLPFPASSSTSSGHAASSPASIPSVGLAGTQNTLRMLRDLDFRFGMLPRTGSQ